MDIFTIYLPGARVTTPDVFDKLEVTEVARVYGEVTVLKGTT